MVHQYYHRKAFSKLVFKTLQNVDLQAKPSSEENFKKKKNLIIDLAFVLY